MTTSGSRLRRRARLAAVIGFALVVSACANSSSTDDGQTSTSESTAVAALDDDESYPGYNLFAPQQGTVTYLTDLDNNVVWEWESEYRPALSVYLLENGNLLRTGNIGNESFTEAGAGGIIQELDPSGGVVWEFTYSSDSALAHHDVAPMPNGNVLMIAWELKTPSEAAAAGRTGTVDDSGLLVDHIVEVAPDGAGGADVVWEWHVWDHLVQDADASIDTFGDPGAEPGRINLNYSSGGPGSSDWIHANSIDYNAELDQILISSRSFSEVWVIDHSTTTAEAATSAGGDSGRGGNLLYRWGNPAAYGQDADQQLFVQHNATWIPDGYPGAGDILVFNNGTGRPGGDYSTVDQFTPPLTDDGSYTLDGTTYGPTQLSWSWQADDPTSFYAMNVSGTQRLASGTTLVVDGVTGLFFEVNDADAQLWQFDYGSLVFKAIRYATDYPGLPDLETYTGSTTATTTAAPSGQDGGQGGGGGAGGGGGRGGPGAR